MAVIVAAAAIAAGMVVLLSSIGALVMRDAVERLHYAGPAATLAPLLMAVGIVIEDGFTSSAGLKACCVAALALAASPIVQYVTLRAIVTRRHGSPDAPQTPELQT